MVNDRHVGRPKEKDNCTPRSYQIPNELLAKIERRNKKTGIPRTTIIIQALTEYFEKIEATQ